jgi:hypothetical protein
MPIEIRTLWTDDFTLLRVGIGNKQQWLQQLHRFRR